MAGTVNIQLVLQTAQVFEASKTAVDASIDLGVSVRTVYNRLEELEKLLGTKQLKRDFPKIYSVRHAKRGPKKLNCDYPDHFIDPPADDTPLEDRAKQQKKDKAKADRAAKIQADRPVPSRTSATAINQRSVLTEVRRRVQAKHSALARPKEAYTDDELKKAVGEKLAQAIFYIDSETLGRAKLSELSQMFKTLFEAKQLLDGKPTTILSRHDKEDLQSLVPKLIAEAKKRGFSFKKDVTGELVENE